MTEQTYQTAFWITQAAKDKIREISAETGLTFSMIVERKIMDLPIKIGGTK